MMEEYWAANQYGGADAGSIYNKQVQELLMELGGGEAVYGNCAALVKAGNTDKDPSADYWGHTQQAKMNIDTMGFTYLGIAVVHYRLLLINVKNGLRTSLLREHMTGSAEDNPRLLTVIRANRDGAVYFLLLFPPETTCEEYDPRNPLKACTLDNNLRTNQDFDIMKVSNLKVTEVDGADCGFTSTGSETFHLEDPKVRDRQGHHRILEISALRPGHATDLNDPDGLIEWSIRDIEGRKAVYDLLRAMVDTGTVPSTFPSLSSSVAVYDNTQESLSSLWNNSSTKNKSMDKNDDDDITMTSSTLKSLSGSFHKTRESLSSLWNSATKLDNNKNKTKDNKDNDAAIITSNTSRSLSGGSTTEVTTATSLSVPFAGIVVADPALSAKKKGNDEDNKLLVVSATALPQKSAEIKMYDHNCEPYV